MVKFNKQQYKPTVTNHEGERAFKGNPYLELYLMTASNLVGEPRYYGDAGEYQKEWVSAIQEMCKKDPLFVLQLAAYTRNELKLRTAPIVMLVEAILSENPEAYQYARTFAPKIIQRADEPAEIVAYYISRRGKIGTDTPRSNGLPNILKKIINDELLSDKFTPYQLVKNDKNNSSVSLRDVLRITHPKVKDPETREFFRRVVKQESFADLSEETWEGYISKHGSSLETWNHVLPSLPIFALVRNLRNILDAGVDRETLQQRVISRLRDANVIKTSRMLPFRFYQAFKEVGGRNFELDAALEEATYLATKHNTPELEGKNVIFVDTSSSMDQAVSNKSTMTMKEIAALIGAILYKKNPWDTELYSYNSDLRKVTNISPQDSIFHIMKNILNDNGGATYAYLGMKELVERNQKFDRIIFLSDEQSYTDRAYQTYSYSSSRYVGNGSKSVAGYLSDYRRTINPNVMLYDINMSGYATLQFDPNNLRTVVVGGWSERVFDLIKLTEDLNKKQDIRALLNSIYNP